uniref:Uncharacterized protein n=1 Tax=Leersia perrieri TaxID=77586 RepID=A0A0D9W0W0_9ORYZ
MAAELKLTRVIIKLGKVHATESSTDAQKLEISLQLINLRDDCTKLVQALKAGEVTGHDAVRMFLSLEACAAYGGGGRQDDADQQLAGPLGAAVPAVLPPGGQIDLHLLHKFGIVFFDLPTNWIDKADVASMMFSLERAMYASKNFIDTKKGISLDKTELIGMRACCCYQPLRPPCPLVPCSKKPQRQPLFHSSSSIRHQSLHVASKVVVLTTTSRGSADAETLFDDDSNVVRPWYNLFGMSFLDVYDQFPESVWDFLEDSPTVALEKKEHKAWMQLRNAMNNRETRALDTNFDESFADSIVFDKTLYKYAILGCKVNSDEIMHKGLISASERKEVIHALERIEDNIDMGKFKWRDGADVHTSIMEALSDMIGDQAKDLAVDSKYDSCLMILETWSKNSIDHIMSQLKQLQVALVFLAIKNDGFVLPGERETEGMSLFMRIVKVLEDDASDLRRFLAGICSIDGFIFPRISSPVDNAFSKPFSMACFAKSINYFIPNHLRQLLEKVLSLRNKLSNAETAIYDTALAKLSCIKQKRHDGDVAVSKSLNMRFGKAWGSPQSHEIEDAKHHLFSSTKSVVEILDLSIKLVKSIPFDMERTQNSLRRGYYDTMKFAHFLTTKGIDSGTAYALVHLCLDKQLQPSELILDDHELKQINFHCDRVHYLLQYKANIFGDSTDMDACKQMLKWCCKLRIDPATILNQSGARKPLKQAPLPVRRTKVGRHGEARCELRPYESGASRSATRQHVTAPYVLRVLGGGVDRVNVPHDVGDGDMAAASGTKWKYGWR